MGAVTKHTILVVDDEPGITATLALILEDSGYEVVTAASRHLAIRAVGSIAFDAALIDVHLPDSDGITLAREICKMRPHCRILLLTGSVDASELQAAGNAASQFDFLSKPVPPEELLERLAAMLQRGKKGATGKSF
jgi:DNA-binding response OmpR family regulator